MDRISPLPLLVSVPHGGLSIPEEARSACALKLPDILADGDTWARTLYDLPEKVRCFLAADVARAVVDLNRPENHRAPDDPDGALKSRTLSGVPVWKTAGAPSDELAEQLLAQHHRPYHEQLA